MNFSINFRSKIQIISIHFYFASPNRIIPPQVWIKSHLRKKKLKIKSFKRVESKSWNYSQNSAQCGHPFVNISSFAIFRRINRVTLLECVSERARSWYKSIRVYKNWIQNFMFRKKNNWTYSDYNSDYDSHTLVLNQTIGLAAVFCSKTEFFALFG